VDRFKPFKYFDDCAASDRLRDTVLRRSRDSSVGLATSWMAGFRFLVEARDFALLHSVQIGSEAHSASYAVGTRDCFRGSKAAGT
jgi:hypothetical protein